MRQISSALMLASLARTALSYGAPRLKKRLKTHPVRDRWGVWGEPTLIGTASGTTSTCIRIESIGGKTFYRYEKTF